MKKDNDLIDPCDIDESPSYELPININLPKYRSDWFQRFSSIRIGGFLYSMLAYMFYFIMILVALYFVNRI